MARASSFCPAWGPEAEVQQVRIDIEGLSGHVPTALVALDRDYVRNICDKFNRSLGFDRKARTAMAANFMRG